MYNPIIDIITKDKDNRRILIFFLIKVYLTFLISIESYRLIYGQFYIISLTDYHEIIDYFINGTALKSLMIFSLTWAVFYFIPSTFLNLLSLKISTYFYKAIEHFVNKPQELEDEIVSNERFGKYVKKIYLTLNAIDVVEISNNEARVGRNFYKFYDYLIDLEKENDSVDKNELSSYFSMVIQFVFLNFWFNLNLIDYNIWTWITSVIVLFFLVLFLLTAHALLTLVELKHTRILNLMEKIDPTLIEEQKNISEVPTSYPKSTSKP